MGHPNARAAHPECELAAELTLAPADIARRALVTTLRTGPNDKPPMGLYEVSAHDIERCQRVCTLLWVDAPSLRTIRPPPPACHGCPL